MYFFAAYCLCWHGKCPLLEPLSSSTSTASLSMNETCQTERICTEYCSRTTHPRSLRTCRNQLPDRILIDNLPTHWRVQSVWSNGSNRLRQEGLESHRRVQRYMYFFAAYCLCWHGKCPLLEPLSSSTSTASLSMNETCQTERICTEYCSRTTHPRSLRTCGNQLPDRIVILRHTRDCRKELETVID